MAFAPVNYSRKTYAKDMPPAYDDVSDLNDREAALDQFSQDHDAETTPGRAIVEAATIADQRTAMDVDSKAEVTAKAEAAQAAAEATAADALAGHVAAADPHTQYQKEEAGKGLSTEDYSTAEKSKLAGVEAGAEVTSLAKVTALAVAEAEVTAAPDHIWVLVGGLLKRWTKAGFEAVVKALLPSTIEAGTATTTPNDTDVIPGVKSDHSMLKYTWANIKAALATFLDRASTTVKGTLLLGASGGAAKLTAMPDGATAVYSQNAWATVDGWSPGAGTSLSVAATPGALRITATSTSGCYAFKTGLSLAGKILFIKYRTIAAGIGVRIWGINTATEYIGSVNGSVRTTIVALPIPLNITTGQLVFAPGVGYTTNDWIEIDDVWVGDYSMLDGSMLLESARVANELAVTQGVGVAASGNIDFSTAAPVQVGDTVTVHGKPYQFVASLSAAPGVEGEILWNSDVYVNHERLRSAIVSGGNGTFSWATIHPTVTMTRPGGNLIGIVSAKNPGLRGNDITLSALAAAVSAGRITLSGSTLTGGKDAVGDKIHTQLQTMPATTSKYGAALLAADGGTTAGTVVQGNDSRLAVSGSWTPELTIGGASTGITYASRSGTYRKTNGFCICTARIQLSSKGALTGALGLSGFPAVSNAVNASYAIVHTDGWASLLSVASLYISASANVATFRYQTASASSPLTNANITDGAYINFLLVYAL